ncbi:MAG: 2-oxoglutarate and iron-dependent oxygenase domain-containing protein, partial [Lysobacteraceae bacterium]
MRTDALPVIDIAPLLGEASADRATASAAVAAGIGDACRTHGFFYIEGHGIDPALQAGMRETSRAFFAKPLAEKMRIGMSRGGRAWRGYFPVGGELTSGRPDLKEGLYLGTELPPDDLRVLAGWPLHGANLWSDDPEDANGPVAMRPVVTNYMVAAC